MCVVFLNVLPVDFYVVIPIRPGLLMVEAKGMVHLMLKGTILFGATRVLYKIQKYVLHYYAAADIAIMLKAPCPLHFK